METVGKLRSIIASVRNGIELGDTVETLEWCADTIELLTKERDEAICSSAEMTGKYRFLNDRFNETRDHLRASLSEAQDTYQKTYDDLAAARAEVESLKKQIGGLEYHLDAARGEVGRLKAELHAFSEDE